MGSKRKNGRSASQNKAWQEGKLAPTTCDLAKHFGSEGDCELALLDLKFPDGFCCPKCGCHEHERVGDRREFRRGRCDWQFSATSGTVLAHTKLPLAKWFRAIWIVAMQPNAASAQRIARELGVSDVTALSVLRRLRNAMGFAMSICKVGGEYVEVDGAHVACGNDGSRVVRPGSGKSDAPVLVAASSEACVIRAASDSNGTTLEEFAAAHVSRNHEVRCDDHGANLQLLGGWDVTMRGSARDGDSEASLPVVHHLISNFKAWLASAFHGVTVDRLQEYADAFSFGHGHRRGDCFGDLLFGLARWPHVRLSEIKGCHVAMPRNEPPREPGEEHNKWLRRKWRNAGKKPEPAPSVAPNLPRNLADALYSAFGAADHGGSTGTPIPSAA